MNMPCAPRLRFAALTLLAIALVWCVSDAMAGPPPSRGRDRSGRTSRDDRSRSDSRDQSQSQNQNQQSSSTGDTSGQAESGSFSMDGGTGPAFASGAEGKSPQQEYATLRLQRTQGFTGRATLFAPVTPYLSASLITQYTNLGFLGDAIHDGTNAWTAINTSIYPTSQYFGVVRGDRVVSSRDVHITTFTMELLMRAGSVGRAGYFKVGPRVVVVSYKDLFVIDNQGQPALGLSAPTLSGQHSERRRDYVMTGGGIAAEMSLGNVVSMLNGAYPFMSYGIPNELMASFVPTVKVSYNAGGSDAIQFSSWDASVRLTARAPMVMAVGGAYVELGWVHSEFRELLTRTGKDLPGLPGPIGNALRTDKLEFVLDYPTVRAGLTF